MGPGIVFFKKVFFEIDKQAAPKREDSSVRATSQPPRSHTTPQPHSLWTLDLNSLWWLNGHSGFLSQCFRNNIISKLAFKNEQNLKVRPTPSVRMPKYPVLSALV